MADWATRVSAEGKKITELQPKPAQVEIDETISNIRRIIREQEELLPDDIFAAEARRRAEQKHAADAESEGLRPRGLLAALWSRLN
ncbi:hypothetical protein [Jhaorihella thermophila]|uniref:Uncharacterized protein n=1 Tax=Jhaorihella thermophila TaxID=488547 RepID=A0A1H5RX36_9RHOB|nr:hypothetical protein [Jhaorihella thermophila]SEF42177.1 hypothetical protein SAMN05421751_101181 [Jhaorihella thermophila]